MATRCFPPAACVLLLLALPAAAVAAGDPKPAGRPDAITQPLEDGCQRDPVGLLTFHTPEWVFVYAHEHRFAARARVAEGTAPAADLAGGDLPQNHAWYDFNADLLLDDDYAYLAGGDPETGTGNFGEAAEPTLHVEWESGTLPPFAWPSAGDRLKVWGSWVWDCGHWGQGFTADPNDPVGTVIADTDYFLPGANQVGGLRGEGTEFHPMRAVVALRESSWRSASAETQADVFISDRGTAAYSEAVCSRRYPPPPSPPGVPPLPYPPTWTACVENPLMADQPVNDRDYTFFVPAPARPSPDAVLEHRVVDRGTPADAPREVIEERPDGIRVTVPFEGFESASGRLEYAKRFFVGWSEPPADPPTLLRIRLKRLIVHDSLDNPGPDTSLGVPPGEWNLYLDINGSWLYLNEIAPGLDHVDNGESLRLGRAVEIHVPAGETLRIEVDGRECDLPRIKPCPPTSELAEDNDSPGTAVALFESAAGALGDRALAPPGDSPRYELRYRVEEIASAP